MSVIDKATASHFEGEIRVGSRIIDQLSSGLYQNPASCLKELVNNSYDADAMVVNVLVRPDAEMIIVADDGEGMTQQTFIRHFKKVSESHKRDDDEKTASGRAKIGKIGIGFIAANELCEEMEIFSTTAGSTVQLHVIIDFEAMRLDPSERRVDDGDEFRKGDYEGELLEVDADEHGTQIFLKRVRGPAREAMVGASVRNVGKENSLYGLKPKQLEQRLRELKSWTELDAYSQTMLGVALNVPVPYFEDWCPDAETAQMFKSFTKTAKGLTFRVNYDGLELRKPVLLGYGRTDRTLRKRIAFKGEHCGAVGYLYAQHGTIKPEEQNGVLIRIRNAAVGEYRDDYFGFPHAEGALFQRWVTGEIWADDRLEVALNIDRRTLRDTHPSFVELRDWFHDELGRFLNEVRVQIYAAESAARNEQSAEVQLEQVRAAASELGAHVGPAAAQDLADAWSPTPRPPAQPSGTPGRDAHRSAETERRKLMAALKKKFTVGDVYEIAVAAARASLGPDDAAKFIAELTRRLRG